MPLIHVVADLGLSPISNEFRSAEDTKQKAQTFYPLTVMVCGSCWLVQLIKVSTPPHFNSDYAYFSSFSSSWLAHAEHFANQIRARLDLGPKSLVLELASNDGYLLQYFKQAGVKVLGIEPSSNVAAFAKKQHDIDSVVEFFGKELGRALNRKGISADLIVGNNVLAHVPDINDFVAGLPFVLAKEGTATFEFPHVLKMLTLGQFDTIYHEHFSYLSLLIVERIFASHNLTLYGLEELPTHGGSLRIYAKHAGSKINDNSIAAGLAKVRKDEAIFGIDKIDSYTNFGKSPEKCKSDLLSFLITAKKLGKTVCGYGAPAKGNTMLNYCGIGPELLPFTTDLSREKQGKYLPGLNIPIHSPEEISVFKPDYIIILPWNLRDEISSQLSYVRNWGAQFVVAIPEMQVF